MKVKTLFACAVTAVSLPLAAVAQNNAQPSGPQGTGWYGAPYAAQPVPQMNPGSDSSALERNDAYAAERRDWRDWRAERRADVRDQRDRRSYTYQGFSADTNPPAPTY